MRLKIVEFFAPNTSNQNALAQKNLFLDQTNFWREEFNKLNQWVIKYCFVLSGPPRQSIVADAVEILKKRR